MPILSQAQRGAMYSAAEGHSTLGIPKSVGKEFVASDHSGKLPEYKRADGGPTDDDPVARALAVLKSLPTSSTGELRQQSAPNKQPAGQQPQLFDPTDAVSSAMRVARQPRAYGGFSPEVPFEERREASNISRSYGFSVGTGGGRTDKNPIDVGAGSYVLPSDIVAGLGEGNSLAGARVWDSVLHSGPFGIQEPQQGVGHRGPPRPPSDPELSKGMFEGGEGAPISPTLADGGKTEDEPKVPILAADGEVIISPDEVFAIGNHYFPSEKDASHQYVIRHGHAILDSMVKEIRGRTIKHLASLPGPVGSENSKQGHNPDAKKAA